METDRYTYELNALGQRIRHLRKKLNLTQDKLRKRSGVSVADISRIENAQKNIELHTIIKLAQGLSVELEDLFSVDKTP